MLNLDYRVNFLGYNCVLDFGLYRNGQTSIQLYDTEINEPVATATSCLDLKINSDEVIIKNYSENEGILEELIKSGIVSEPVELINSGYAVFNVCKLLVDIGK